MNENRIRLISYLLAPFIAVLGIVYNNYGNAQFRDSIFQVQLLVYFVVIVMAFGIIWKYSTVWYLIQLRVQILWKWTSSIYMIISTSYFIPLLLQWIADKSYKQIHVQSDQNWSSVQLGFAVAYAGANLGAFLDFENLINVRLAKEIETPLFWRTFC
ncbi:MAG: hypothetical protein OMM_01330 [Candidatus Magnetoglobus multicellularis str. Araruama]|uniref:Uncharacterized protein n=1 Tax=Candidatus Magnetoglobus multicellularis str. Araruama TaxID=890399 RepID=A0A1V1PDT7_9BACT|nr:MAG: hypothetical protein OMM_01330 [Candidatus Magnetoglobus multicellularis str. Araruama]